MNVSSTINSENENAGRRRLSSQRNPDGNVKSPQAGEDVSGVNVPVLYLASPYSHPNPAVREHRFCMACRAAARLMRAGHVVFSPIAHSHPIARFGLPTDWSFWERQDREHLARCDELVVLLLEGCRESRGVRAEIRLAENLGKPIRYLIPEGVIVSPTLARVAKEGRL